jgi:hypothetical protein
LLTFIECGFFTEVHQKFLCSGHSFVPCNRDFAVIEKKKKVSYVIFPSQWKYAISESRINKSFTVVEIEQPHFKDLEVSESTMKRDQNLKITQVLCLRFSADDPAAVYIRKSHNIMRPWERYSVM